jgi:hypothetical protein
MELDEETQRQAEEVKADDRVIPSPRQRLAAVELIVDALEGYSDTGREDILQMASKLLGPTFDRHEFAMHMIEAMKRMQGEEAERVAAVRKHRDGSSTQVRNVDKELWSAFDLTPPEASPAEVSR